MKQEVKEYLIEKNIQNEEQLANHILELRRNTFTKPILFELVELLYNNKAVLLSFFAEKDKPKGILQFTALEESILTDKAQEELSRKHIENNKGFYLDEVMERIENQKYSTNTTLSDKEQEIFKQWNTKVEIVKYEDECKGVKKTEGKLYYELSWEFIEEMAKRMANNKSDKYPLYNWKKNIDVEELKQAINRHHIEVMKGNYRDEGEVLGHIVSYACNAMMLWEQLK